MKTSFGVWRQFIVGRLKQKKTKPLNPINGFKLWCRGTVTRRLRFPDCNHRCRASQASVAQREGGAGDSPLRISFDFPRQGTDSTHGTQLLTPPTLTNFHSFLCFSFCRRKPLRRNPVAVIILSQCLSIRWTWTEPSFC